MDTREMKVRARRERARLGNRNGAVLVFVALGLVVFLGIAALAVDLGLLYVARGEAQRAADAAAHAGAGFYQLNRERPDADQVTRSFVREFAENNEVRGLPVRVDAQQDIDVLPTEGLVRVRVRRTDDAVDGPVATLFARILGFREVGVSASAAAQIFGARAVGCMLPVALPDRWRQADGSFPGPDDPYEPTAGDFYDEVTTGYRIPEDLGTLILIRPPPPGGGGGGGGGGNTSRITPSWWGTIEAPEFDFSGSGPPEIAPAIRDCDGDPFGPGAEVEQASGNMQARGILDAWQDVIDSDLDASWNQALGCVTDLGGSVCRTSPRLRPMVFFSPDQPITGPGTPVEVTRILGVFVERIFRDPSGGQQQYQVEVRLARLPSTLPGDNIAGPGDAITAIRIVE